MGNINAVLIKQRAKMAVVSECTTAASEISSLLRETATTLETETPTSGHRLRAAARLAQHLRLIEREEGFSQSGMLFWDPQEQSSLQTYQPN